MLVELKKVKITQSILKQVLQASFTELVAGNVLGWVIDRKVRKILIYNPDTQVLRFQYFPSEFKIDTEWVQIDNHGTREFRHFIYYYSQNGSAYYKFDKHDEESVKGYYTQLVEFKNAAITAGQIYF